jgi:hypothetical protein
MMLRNYIMIIVSMFTFPVGCQREINLGSLGDVKEARPDAHPIFAKMFEDFYTGKEELCPVVV